MNVYEKLMNVQSNLKSPKSQTNTFGKYKYRSCEDILESVKPLLTQYKAIVNLSDEVIQIGERFYIKATASFTDVEKGENIQVSAWAREDETKKGMDLAQVTGSVSSYARKYALNGLFCIDDTKDSDSTNTHGKDSGQGNALKIENNSTTTTTDTENTISDEQIEELFKTASSKGYSIGQVKSSILARYKVVELSKLTKEQYDTIVKGYESAPKKEVK